MYVSFFTYHTVAACVPFLGYFCKLHAQVGQEENPLQYKSAYHKTPMGQIKLEDEGGDAVLVLYLFMCVNVVIIFSRDYSQNLLALRKQVIRTILYVISCFTIRYFFQKIVELQVQKSVKSNRSRNP